MNEQKKDAQLKELEEENELLLLQLHQVQEELERYYLRNQELEKGGIAGNTVTASTHGWVDKQLPETLAETTRLNTLFTTQTYLQRIESTNALNARLGNLLIQSASQGGNLLSVPGKLLKIWRESEAKAIPASLGGKDCDKVIAAYREGGVEAVNALLTKIHAPVVKANVYTILARQLHNEDWETTARLARLAYEEDPRPYRLKWLAFRLYEVGEIIEADAMLSLLPEEASFSDSELRQQDQIRYEASNIRLREAKQKTNFDSRRQAIENQLKQLQQEHTTQADLATERQLQIEALQGNQAQLKQEKEDLAKQHKEAAQLVEMYSNDIVTLRREKVELTKGIEQLKQHAAQTSEKNKLLLSRLHQVQEELERFNLDKGQLEQEKAVLTKQQEEAEKLIAARNHEIEELKQVQTQLKQERAAKEVELTSKIEALQKHQTQLEQEKTTLTKQQDEAEKLAAARLKQINELQQQIQNSQANEAELASCQQLMQEEMVRAEAQIDLIKDLLLQEAGI